MSEGRALDGQDDSTWPAAAWISGIPIAQRLDVLLTDG
jgi:hypothetical protein